MIRGYFKRKSPASGFPDEGEWELGNHPASLVELQKIMIKGDPNHIIFVTDPNVEPMRVIIRSDDGPFDQDSNKSNTLELYYYRSKGGDEI